MVECKDLKKMDLMGKSDPFVKVFLMPGNHKELKTKVIKKNLNPLFNEVFKFVVSETLIHTLYQLKLVSRFLLLKFQRRQWSSKFLTGTRFPKLMGLER